MSSEDISSPPSLLGAESHATLVSSLLRELSIAGITEAELSYGTLRVVLRRRPNAAWPSPIVAPQQETDSAAREGWVAVAAPLAGVYYNRETPDAEPFVYLGSTVHAGQPVGLIESMKMFNEVTSETPGIVREIVVSAGEVVQAAQVLLYIEPVDEATQDARLHG